MKKKKIIGFYDYTVVLTYLGFIFAFLGITKTINGFYTDAVFCLIAAGVCDMFDGAVASTKDRNQYEKHFGIQIDSLCDLVSFGVLPAIFVYLITDRKPVVGILSCVFTLCALIRLAYFNVQEYDRQQKTDEKREVYLGVPITASALVIPFAYLFYSKLTFIGTWIFPFFTALLGAGYIAGIEIKKPNLAGKLIMILVGVLEMIGVFLFSGADIL